ncbi:MAG TPA: sulfite exporter TauE/SafE family protein [Acidimicrobiales bacterium]|nr:sulfite exporter TauE/SafE family protein [Acidimicrobiales bacterium]
MRLLLTLPLGLLVGLALGALGGGGSILAVPALVYVIGVGPKEAVTTSLVIVGVAALGGMVGHWRAGRVRVAAGLWFSLAGVAGSLLGTRLNRAVNPEILLAAFAVLMMVAAWRMQAAARHPQRLAAAATSPVHSAVATGLALMEVAGTLSVQWHSSGPALRGRARPSMSMVAKVILAGTVVGFMTGFFGVGGGFVIVPALVLALGFDMPIAVGTSLLVIGVNCAVALISRLAATGVEWRVALPFTAAGLAGALAGNYVATRARPPTLMRWFAALLVVLAIYTLARSVTAI